MSLRDNLITLLNQSFFKTEEKPAKYMEWLISEYSNGKWYICENFIYHNNGSDIELYNPQNAIITTENGILKITTNTDGEKKVSFPTEWFTTYDNVYMEMTYCGGTTQPIALCLNTENNNSVGWLSYDGASTFVNALGSSNINITHTATIGDVFRLERYNGVTDFYQNGELLFSGSRTFNDKFRFGFYTNNGRVQSWKDIKIGYITRQLKIQNEHLLVNEIYENSYKLENSHLYVDTDDITQYKIKDKHLYKKG